MVNAMFNTMFNEIAQEKLINPRFASKHYCNRIWKEKASKNTKKRPFRKYADF